MHEEITEQRREVPEDLKCRHIFIDGHRCGSYALRNEHYCYYHHEKRKPAPDPQARYARRNSVALPLPKSRAAIQEAIGKVITYLAFNDIDRRRAGLILYGLQLATLNLNQQQKQKQEPQPQPGIGGIESPTHRESESGYESGCPTSGSSDVGSQDAQTQPHSAHECAFDPIYDPESDPGLNAPSFHQDAFPLEQTFGALTRPVFAALIEDIALLYGVKPSTGSPEDRKTPPEETNETILPSLQATNSNQYRSPSRSRHRSSGVAQKSSHQPHPKAPTSCSARAHHLLPDTCYINS